MTRRAIVVFTWEPKERVIAQGGTEDWYLRPSTANQCEYVVLMRNAHPPDGLQPGPEPHGTGFLVGRLAGTRATKVVRQTQRYHLAISEYAEISIPRLRDKTPGQNPVQYSTLDALGIDPTKLHFVPVTKGAAPPPPGSPPGRTPPHLGRTLSQIVAAAKEALADELGVEPERIDISVRW